MPSKPWRSPLIGLFGLVIVVAVGYAQTVPSTAQPWFPSLRLGSTFAGRCTVQTGSGSPESAVTGNICDVYLRTDGGTDTVLYIKESGTGNTGWVGKSGVTAGSTATFTNKTLDAEGTGNVLTISFTYDFPGSVCDANSGPWSNWDFASAHGAGQFAPDYVCLSPFTNGPTGALEYLDSDTQYAYNHLVLPGDWTGAIDVKLFWSSPATSGNVVWQIETACYADNEDVDPAWNSAQLITDAAKAVAGRNNVATLSNLTTTGCAAGEILRFAIFRDPTNASDTLGNTAHLLNVQLTLRRAM